jgi:hypothetical protein
MGPTTAGGWRTSVAGRDEAVIGVSSAYESERVRRSAAGDRRRCTRRSARRGAAEVADESGESPQPVEQTRLSRAVLACERGEAPVAGFAGTVVGDHECDEWVVHENGLLRSDQRRSRWE